MRKPRLKGDQEVNFYHIILKAPDRTPGNSEFAFGDVEKLKMEELIEDLEETYLIRVIGICCMSTHLHVTIQHDRDAAKCLSATELKRRYEKYRDYKYKKVDARWRAVRQFRQHINDISVFTAVLAQKFSFWYNKRNGHRGNVWTPRFKSVLLTSAQALVRCLQYIELNPLRAHMVQHPKDYRFSSWSHICRGDARGLEFKRRIIAALRIAFGWLREKWSDKKIFSYYRLELQLIDEHGLMGRKTMEKLGASFRALILFGNSWLSGYDGVISIGGDRTTLILKTGRKTDVLQQSWKISI